jgi:KTSC domain
MERIAVESSNIIAIGYDAESMILEVEFGKDGPEDLTNRIYQYQNVPFEIFEKFLDDDSHGGYLSSNIRGEYPYQFLGRLEEFPNSK